MLEMVMYETLESEGVVSPEREVLRPPAVSLCSATHTPLPVARRGSSIVLECSLLSGQQYH